MAHRIEGDRTLPWSAALAGRIDEHVLDSELLRGNPLGDPTERPLWVQLPPGYDTRATAPSRTATTGPSPASPAATAR